LLFISPDGSCGTSVWYIAPQSKSNRPTIDPSTEVGVTHPDDKSGGI
jgi:hypothetical protein